MRAWTRKTIPADRVKPRMQVLCHDGPTCTVASVRSLVTGEVKVRYLDGSKMKYPAGTILPVLARSN